MAKKEQNKKTTKNTPKDSVETMTEFWSSFSSEMENKLGQLFEKSAVDYQDLYKNWTDLSETMGKQMMNVAMGDESIWNNMYNSWNEYSEQMNLNIGKMPNNEDQMHNDFLSYWSKYSDKFNDHLTDLFHEGFKEQHELYELWMDAFAKSAEKGSKAGDIPSIVNKYWLETFNRFHEFYSRGGSTSKPGQPETAEQMVKQFENLHNTWVDTSQKMVDEIMRSSNIK